MKKHGWLGQTPLWGLEEELERGRSPLAMPDLREFPEHTAQALSDLRSSRSRPKRSANDLPLVREEALRPIDDSLEPISLEIDSSGNLVIRSQWIPARVKPRPRTTMTGHVYMPQDYSDWKKEVASTLARALKFMPLFPQARLEMRLWVWTSRGDVDNLAGGVMDAMTGMVWTDDSQVVDLFVRKRAHARGLPKWVAVVGPVNDEAN